MPGSYYELSNANGAAISSDQAERWVQLFTRYNLTTNFENKLMFIPTVSSLDIGEGKVELTQSDYEKKYLMNFPPASPKHTPVRRILYNRRVYLPYFFRAYYA